MSAFVIVLILLTTRGLDCISWLVSTIKRLCKFNVIGKVLEESKFLGFDWEAFICDDLSVLESAARMK